MVAVPPNELLSGHRKIVRPFSFAPRGLLILPRLRRGVSLHFLSCLAKAIHPIHLGIVVAVLTLRLEMVWYRRISRYWLDSGCIQLGLQST